MNLTEHYQELYKSSIEKIKKGEYQTDPLIDSPTDRRFGITLLIRPPQPIKENIQVFLEELKRIDPFQYYYANSDLHITVLSIISCYEGFELDQISISEYSDVVKQSFRGIEKFKIEFRGITASDSGIMIQGFPENEMLDNIRSNLSINFKSSALQQSIDKRYSIQTAHATVVRFRKELRNRNEFLAGLERFRNYNFGSFEVNEW